MDSNLDKDMLDIREDANRKDLARKTRQLAKGKGTMATIKDKVNSMNRIFLDLEEMARPVDCQFRSEAESVG